MKKLITILILANLCIFATLFGNEQSVELVGEQLTKFIFFGGVFVGCCVVLILGFISIVEKFREEKANKDNSKRTNQIEGNLSSPKGFEEPRIKNGTSIYSPPLLTKTSEEQNKVKSQQKEIKPNLVKSEDEVLASFPDASIVIEYDEYASKLWNELKDLDKEIGYEFIEFLQKDPKQNIDKLYADLKGKFEKQKFQQEHPYADPNANKAFQEALQISEAAKDEFSKVYELMKDKLEPDEILEKVKTKHQNNNWRWK